MEIDQFQELIGVQFNDTALLIEALTHRSYLNEHIDEGLRDNERLEFLGDAIIDYITADMLFLRFPELPEGDLTRLRAALVRTEALAEFARKCQIGEVLRIGKGEEMAGGRARRTLLCRTFEAVVGALYLDQGLEPVKTFIMPLLLELLDRVKEEALEKDARSRLQEFSQLHYNITPIYRKVDDIGPEHDKEFIIEALIGDAIVGQGIGKSKRAAAQAAAADALARLIPPPSAEPAPIPASEEISS